MFISHERMELVRNKKRQISKYLISIMFIKVMLGNINIHIVNYRKFI